MLTRPFFLLPWTISKIPIRTINFSKFSENLSVPSSQCLTVCYKQYGQIVTDCGNSLSFYDRFEVKRDDRSLRVLLSFHTVMDDRLQVKRSLAILIAVYTWENMFSDKNVKKEFPGSISSDRHETSPRFGTLMHVHIPLLRLWYV